MPELPEVENLRRGLEKKVLGQKIKKIIIRRAKLVSGPGNLRVASKKKAKEFIRSLTGETISRMDRRAKNLIFRFKSGKILLAHLKMSGQFIYKDDKPFSIKTPEGKHTHIIFELSKGTLFYNDIRTFGYLLYFPNEQALGKAAPFKDIGSEPLSAEFTPEYFCRALKNKKTNIKALLLGQSAVAGLGNIYTDEALFAARIRPTRLALSLKPKEVNNLYSAIKKILLKTIQLGGSSVDTYRLLDESRGSFAKEHKVYGRAGEKCLRCGSQLISKKIAGRTTVYCPNCQK